MIGKILSGVITLIISLVNLILTPIDNLITSALPDLSNALTAVGGFISLCTQSIGWVISLSGLSSSCISLIVVYFTFKLTAPLLFYFIKLALSWYNRLKP